jgi:outer membrane cobalamin receptor
MKKLCFVIVLCFSQSALSAEDEMSPLLAMTLAELGQIQFSTSATLTATPLDKVPASITLISREMIDDSGARNLYELVDIHTPGLQRMVNATAGTGNALGFRGLVHSDKFLIMVNGQIMSALTQPLARTEHSLALLGDIDYIEVVRGPGSSVHGPGAITGIIHIHTFDSSSHEGFEASFRQGFGEQFNTADFKWSHKFNDDNGFFLYYGIDNYDGADADDAPYILSTDLNSGSLNFPAGEPIAGISNDRAAYRGQLRHKLQMQLDGNKYKAWLRYTKGGDQFVSGWTRLNNVGSLLPEKRGSGY